MNFFEYGYNKLSDMKNRLSSSIKYTEYKTVPTKINKRPPLGLPNLGATCYLNSVLQMLFSCDDFRTEMVKLYKGNFKILSDETQRFVYNLSRLMCFMAEERKDSIRNITGDVRQFFYHSMNGDDIHKCYLQILTKVDDVVGTLERFNYAKVLNCGFIHDKFVGQISYETKCDSCGKSFSEVTQDFKSMPLQISNSRDLSIEKCVREFFQESTVIDSEHQCCAKRKIISTNEYNNAPKYLFIYFVRGGYRRTEHKKNTNVKFRKRLNIPTRDLDVSYKLLSVIDHSGGNESGHYIVKTARNGHWWYMSDESVTEISWGQVPTENAIGLCYEKVSSEDSDDDYHSVPEELYCYDNRKLNTLETIIKIFSFCPEFKKCLQVNKMWESEISTKCLMSDLFEGTESSRIVCSKCGTVFQTEDTRFLSVNVTVEKEFSFTKICQMLWTKRKTEFHGKSCSCSRRSKEIVLEKTIQRDPKYLLICIENKSQKSLKFDKEFLLGETGSAKYSILMFVISDSGKYSIRSFDQRSLSVKPVAVLAKKANKNENPNHQPQRWSTQADMNVIKINKNIIILEGMCQTEKKKGKNEAHDSLILLCSVVQMLYQVDEIRQYVLDDTLKEKDREKQDVYQIFLAIQNKNGTKLHELLKDCCPRIPFKESKIQLTTFGIVDNFLHSIKNIRNQFESPSAARQDGHDINEVLWETIHSAKRQSEDLANLVIKLSHILPDLNPDLFTYFSFILKEAEKAYRSDEIFVKSKGKYRETLENQETPLEYFQIQMSEKYICETCSGTYCYQEYEFLILKDDSLFQDQQQKVFEKSKVNYEPRCCKVACQQREQYIEKTVNHAPQYLLMSLYFKNKENVLRTRQFILPTDAGDVEYSMVIFVFYKDYEYSVMNNEEIFQSSNAQNKNNKNLVAILAERAEQTVRSNNDGNNQTKDLFTPSPESKATDTNQSLLQTVIDLLYNLDDFRSLASTNDSLIFAADDNKYESMISRIKQDDPRFSWTIGNVWNFLLTEMIPASEVNAKASGRNDPPVSSLDLFELKMSSRTDCSKCGTVKIPEEDSKFLYFNVNVENDFSFTKICQNHFEKEQMELDECGKYSCRSQEFFSVKTVKKAPKYLLICIENKSQKSLKFDKEFLLDKTESNRYTIITIVCLNGGKYSIDELSLSVKPVAVLAKKANRIEKTNLQSQKWPSQSEDLHETNEKRMKNEAHDSLILLRSAVQMLYQVDEIRQYVLDDKSKEKQDVYRIFRAIKNEDGTKLDELLKEHSLRESDMQLATFGIVNSIFHSICDIQNTNPSSYSPQQQQTDNNEDNSLKRMSIKTITNEYFKIYIENELIFRIVSIQNKFQEIFNLEKYMKCLANKENSVDTPPLPRERTGIPKYLFIGLDGKLGNQDSNKNQFAPENQIEIEEGNKQVAYSLCCVIDQSESNTVKWHTDCWKNVDLNKCQDIESEVVTENSCGFLYKKSIEYE